MSGTTADVRSAEDVIGQNVVAAVDFLLDESLGAVAGPALRKRHAGRESER
jgi:hypothetical protein